MTTRVRATVTRSSPKKEVALLQHELLKSAHPGGGKVARSAPGEIVQFAGLTDPQALEIGLLLKRGGLSRRYSRAYREIGPHDGARTPRAIEAMVPVALENSRLTLVCRYTQKLELSLQKSIGKAQISGGSPSSFRFGNKSTRSRREN
jgi:hypothetical protein